MPLRFTIRDLFWLVLVAALAGGWWIDHARIQSERDEVIRQCIAPIVPQIIEAGIKNGIEVIPDSQCPAQHPSIQP
jgi:hypothetical protein